MTPSIQISNSHPGGSIIYSQPRATVSISVEELGRLCSDYLRDCELSCFSPQTIETRNEFFRNLQWFLRHRNYTTCGETEIRNFLHYLAHGHEDPGGRFGNKRLDRAARPVTVRDYYNCFRRFFAWSVEQGRLSENPVLPITKPIVHEETKTPLSTEQIGTLLRAADVSSLPVRNRAILTLLLDTGCRASELLSIRPKDFDLMNGRCQVLGKGNKYRTLFFGERTADAVSRYIAERGGEPTTRLFRSAKGDGDLTRSGLLQLIKALGRKAGIREAVCVHAMRRSFAVHMLRNGASVFSVQEMLGHTNLQQTRKYCALALADSEAQHRQFSPMDRLMSGRKW